MTDAPRPIPVVFHRTAGGAEPVREWLLRLDTPDRHAIGRDLMRAQYRWPVGMPLLRAMGDGLFEVRTSLPSRAIARVFLCHHDGALFALHGFTKTTQRTPVADLELARRRKKEVEDG